jgi:hypothetical protein
MKVKSLYEQYKQEFMASDVEYCCYCLEPKEDKISCCQENHFITFRDFDPEDQQYIINTEIELAFGAD